MEDTEEMDTQEEIELYDSVMILDTEVEEACDQCYY